MSDESKQINDPSALDREPTAGDVSAPVWLIVLLTVLLWIASMFLDGRAGGFNEEVYRPYPSIAYVKELSITDPPEIVRGRALYRINCSGCHQESGNGVAGQFPPLAGSDWVIAEKPDRLVRIAMNGLKGAIHVNGVPFNEAGTAVMLSVGSDTKFKAEQVADLLSFIRSNADWGNAASIVTADEISDAYAAAEARGKVQWTEAELLEIPVGAAE